MRVAALLFRVASFAIVVFSLYALLWGSGAVALLTPGREIPVPAPQPQSPEPSLPPVPEDSPTNNEALNWAGYIATGGTYTSVSGSWKVPEIAASEEERGDVADATWVGIGGVVSNDLIQAGTEAIRASGGDTIYRAWMELLPDDSKSVPLSIAPGDSISVAITEQGEGMWDITFKNDTTGQQYETNVPYASSLSSADWVEEMPVEVGGSMTLDQFGSVQFADGFTTDQGERESIRAAGAEPLTMNNSRGQALARPSVLGPDGASFAVLRTEARSTPLALSKSGETVPASDDSISAFLSHGGGFEAVSIPGILSLHF